jgi:protein gp37
MGKDSHISWTDNTFNPIWGCTKVSEGCKLCYAETLAKRWGFDVWGDDKPRRFFGEKHWQEPLVWNKQAAVKGIKETVFCGSMCDIFEPRGELDKERWQLWKLIEETPNLIWLLLTKRPEYIHMQVPQKWLSDGFPMNVWLGVTIENNDYQSRLIEIENFEVKKFVSVEPMLGSIEFNIHWCTSVDWVIIGGQSGAGCQAMNLIEARYLVELCQYNRIPVFMKQLGGFPDKQDQIEEWPESLKVQQFPEWE